MTTGLSPNDIVNVTLTMNPVAISTANFGSLLVVGPSTTIPPGERIRQYSNIEGVTADFASNTPEYAAAALFYSQRPQPSTLFIGRRVVGVTPETPLAAVQACANASNAWYGLMTADPGVTDTDHIAISGYIEATGRKIYGYTTQDIDVLDPTFTTDLASRFSGLGMSRTFGQFSLSSPYAVASLFGRAFTVDFNAINTTITLKFKQEPGVTAEVLTETQAATLKGKNCNAYVKYNNGAQFVQEGVMANGFFFDEVHNGDWLVNAVQTALFNLFYTTPTKIPQTDEGTEMQEAVITAVMAQARANGMIAPGTWTSAMQFGTLKTNDILPTGYYMYGAPIRLQLQADREARKGVPIQIAIKLAGAVHSGNVGISVNR